MANPPLASIVAESAQQGARVKFSKLERRERLQAERRDSQMRGGAALGRPGRLGQRIARTARYLLETFAMRFFACTVTLLLLPVACSNGASGHLEGSGGANGGSGDAAGGRAGSDGVAGSGGDSATGASASDSPQPKDWDADLRIERLLDESPDPDIFETHLVAKLEEVEIVPGLITEVYTYGGSVPGPEIRVKRGDRVIVHFKNELPEETSIHWHGLRVPNNMDGVPGITQEPVGPGQTFTYDFVVPDAGTFWYHPHIRSAAQVGFGMYGPFIVTDPDEPDDLGEDLTLVLSDMSLDDYGELLPADAGSRVDSVFGREGNVLLVNGKVEPVLRARSGRRQRWRIINAARSRYFEVGIEGQSFLRFAGDAGTSEHTVEEDTSIIIPAERKELIFDPEVLPGSVLKARWLPTDRGYGSTFGRVDEPLFSIEFSDQEPYDDKPLPTLGREIPPIDTTGVPITTLAMTLDLDPDGYPILGINNTPFWNATPLQATIGETQVWKLTNETDFAHPFHLHGYLFQVLTIDGEPPPVREWKDTVNISVDGTTTIVVRFDDRPGTWMTHCHILDHAELGMMTTLVVTDPNDLSAGGMAGASGQGMAGASGL